MKAIIFTDGSSKGNPGPGGWGAIIGFYEGEEKKVREIGAREVDTTNNRMEMTAVIEGLSFVKENASDSEITLYTDSEYVKKGATEWITGWQKNNWRTAARKDVLNKDLWQRMLETMKGLNIKWQVVPGHAGVSANERCDVIATSFADGIHPGLYDGPYADYKVSFDIKPRGQK
jgi:ribonuclease HI